MRHYPINRFQQKGEILTTNFKIFTLAALIILVFNTLALASGLFGPPQTVSKETGGLNTAIGYFYYEDTFKKDTDHLIRQNSIYSQVGYGANNMWEIYGRIGVADLKIFDVFISTDALTTTNKNNFEENWKFLVLWGQRAFIRFLKYLESELSFREHFISVIIRIVLREAITAYLMPPSLKSKIFGTLISAWGFS